MIRGWSRLWWPPRDRYQQVRWTFVAFSLVSAGSVILLSTVAVKPGGVAALLLDGLLVVLMWRWVLEYRGSPFSRAWLVAEAAVIGATALATDPAYVLMLFYARLAFRSLELEGWELAAIGAAYAVSMFGGVLVSEYLHRLADRPDQLLLLASAFPMVVVVMQALGVSMRRTSELAADLEAEQALREAESYFRLLFEQNPEPMFVYDLETGQCLEVNRAAVEHYGYNRDEFLALEAQQLVAPEDRARLQQLMLDDTNDVQPARQWRHQLKDGRIIWVDLALHRLEFRGRPAVLVLATDVTERRELDEKLRHQAFHDTLTGLANRALFRERVQLAIARGERTDTRWAVVFVDLDNFKTINDSVGHEIGDSVLVEIGGRLQQSMRPTDTAARLGGDEFALLIEDVATEASALRAVGRIARELGRPVALGDDSWFISGSFGVAFGDAGATVDDVLRSADVAMYDAKRRGRGQVAIFEPGMHAAVIDRLELESELRLAISGDKLEVVYQPLMDLRRNVCLGVEALVRWEHPRRGPISPAEFIPLAEEAGMVAELDGLVLRTAVRQLREWLDAGFDGLSVAVNISGRDLSDPGLVERVDQAVRAAGVPPTAVELEVTETAAFEAAEARMVLNQLRDRGFRVAVDDFGVGYSMLSRLQDLAVDRLKIDRSFIERITFGEDEAPIVSGIIAMAHSLRLEVVAEGIETSEQLVFLRRAGCDVGQGYRLGRPQPPAQMEKWLRTQVNGRTSA